MTEGCSSLFSAASATAMRVLLYEGVDDPDPTDIIEFDPDLNRWGHIWSVFAGHVGPASDQLLRPTDCTVAGAHMRYCFDPAGPANRPLL